MIIEEEVTGCLKGILICPAPWLCSIALASHSCVFWKYGNSLWIAQGDKRKPRSGGLRRAECGFYVTLLIGLWYYFGMALLAV